MSIFTISLIPVLMILTSIQVRKTNLARRVLGFCPSWDNRIAGEWGHRAALSHSGNQANASSTYLLSIPKNCPHCESKASVGVMDSGEIFCTMCGALIKEV